MDYSFGKNELFEKFPMNVFDKDTTLNDNSLNNKRKSIRIIRKPLKKMRTRSNSRDKSQNCMMDFTDMFKNVHIYDNDVYVNNITGKEYNNIYKYDKMCMIATNDEYSNGFNDTEVIFFREQDIYKYTNDIALTNKYVYNVLIPSDATVTVYPYKFKTNKVYLTNKNTLNGYIVSMLIDICSSEYSNEIIIEKMIGIISNTTYILTTEQINSFYIIMLEKDVELIRFVPLEHYTYEICMFLAKNHGDGYNLTIQVWEWSEIIYECVKSFPMTYLTLNDIHKTPEMAQIVFDYSVTNYEKILPEHITIDMSIGYCKWQFFDYKYVPRTHYNHPDIIDKIIESFGMNLCYIEYRNKSYELCRIAVKKDGLALYYVPYYTIDEDMCIDAIIDNYSAYTYVPTHFRTEKFNMMYLKYANTYEAFSYIGYENITHNMMLLILSLNARPIKLLLTNNKFIELLKENMIEYIKNDINKHLPVILDINELPLYIFRRDSALEYSKKYNTNVFCNIYTDVEFQTECVKNGSHFLNLENKFQTFDRIIELIKFRSSVIWEIPSNMLCDTFFITLMKEHKVSIDVIPYEYITANVVKESLNSKDKDDTLSSSIILDSIPQPMVINQDMTLTQIINEIVESLEPVLIKKV